MFQIPNQSRTKPILKACYVLLQRLEDTQDEEKVCPQGKPRH